MTSTTAVSTKKCLQCGTPVPLPKRGPVGDYCSKGCKQQAYRNRHQPSDAELRERVRQLLTDLTIPAENAVVASLFALDGSELSEVVKLATAVAGNLQQLVERLGVTTVADAPQADEPLALIPAPEPTPAPIVLKNPNPAPSADGLTPTAEQQAIIEAAQDGKHLVIQAGAGTGKTSTLKMVARAISGQRGIYVAYNKSIATEARASFPSNIQCVTAHSLAFQSCGREFAHRLNGPRQPAKRAAELLKINEPLTLDQVRLQPPQLARIVVDTVAQYCYSADKTIEHRHVPFQHGIVNAAHDALARVIVPFARKAWADLTTSDGQLKFTHDVYLKLYQLSKPTLAVDVVMLDEAQDSNPVVADIVQSQRHAQRIAVGDSCQQLYGWRGASDFLERAEADARLFLSHSYRFGAPVATEANKWLAYLGTTMRLTGAGTMTSTLTPLAEPAAILCRTNGEAMAQVMQALQQGRRPALVGGGKQIRALAEAARDLQAGRGTFHPELYVFETWGQLQEYVEHEAAGSDLKPFVDLIDGHGVEKIINAVDRLVDERGADVTISTAHKAKGREFTSVKIAADFREPKKRADGGVGTIPRDLAMTAYVAVTRSAVLDRGGLAWIDKYL